MIDEMTQVCAPPKPPHGHYRPVLSGSLAALGDWMSLTPDEPARSPDFEERRKQSIWERLDAIEQECRRGHRDLRKSVNELEAQADSLDKDIKWIMTRQKEIADAPVESTKLRFSPSVIVSIVVVTVSIVGGAYSIANKIDTLKTEMVRQAADDKRERDSLARLYDERNTRTFSAIDALTRQQKLLEYEMQRLREDVTQKGGSTR